jgi:hypothetical protein
MHIDIELFKREQSQIIQKYGKDKILLVYDDIAGEKKFWNSNEVKKLLFNICVVFVQHKHISIYLKIYV